MFQIHGRPFHRPLHLIILIGQPALFLLPGDFILHKFPLLAWQLSYIGGKLVWRLCDKQLTIFRFADASRNSFALPRWIQRLFSESG